MREGGAVVVGWEAGEVVDEGGGGCGVNGDGGGGSFPVGGEDQDGFGFYGGGYLAADGGELAVSGMGCVIHDVWLGVVSQRLVWGTAAGTRKLKIYVRLHGSQNTRAFV